MSQNNYGKAIVLCRTALGMQQSELATMAQISKGYLSLLEAGKRKPSVSSLERICEAMNVPHHLLMLLALPKGDLMSRPDEELNMLGRSLLSLLAESEDDERSIST